MRPLVIIPLYNEEETLAQVLVEVRRHTSALILVVNDGSTDRSAEILRRAAPGIEVIAHAQNEGYGQSLIDGFHYAVRQAFDVAVTIDCDLQHEPRLIPRFLEAAAGFDIVSGSRYHPDAGIQDPAPADRVAGLARMTLDERSYGMPLQVWIQAARLGLTVTEIPVPRIYKNPDRRFWGGLDDPQTRRTYYLSIIDREMSRWRNSS